MRRFLVSLALLAPLLACARRDPPRVLHLDFAAPVAKEERAPPEPLRLVPVQEKEKWTAEGGTAGWVVIAPGAGGGRDLVGLAHDAGTGSSVVYRRTGLLDLAAFDQVRITVTASGHAYVTVRGLSGGSVVFESDETPIRQGRELHDVGVDLAVPEGAVVDTLELVFTGARRTLGLAALEFVAVPLSDLVPDPGGPPVPVRLGEQSRLGEGVVSGRPVECRIDAAPGAELRLAWGRPRIVARRSADAVLHLEVSREDGDVVSEARIEVPRGEGVEWSSLALSLPRRGGRLRVSARLDAASGRAAVVIAEVRVVVPSDDPPTVLLVTSDTHRADHLRAAPGSVDVDTPFLDRLAARGVLFADAWSPTNITNPSHLSLLTGVSPRDHGIWVNNRPVSDAPFTLQEAFREAGFTTWAAVSARFLGEVGSGLGQGFDRMDAPTSIERRGRDTVAVVEEWLAESGDEPLFLWVHVYDAHRPYDPPRERLARYWPPDRDPRDPSRPALDLPERLLPEPGLRDLDYPRALYRAEVTELDDALGRLLERPRFRRAVCAFLADHGEALGESFLYFDHGLLRPRVLAIPLVLAGGGLPAGEVRSDPVSHLDVAKTLLELAGLPAEAARFGGRSLVSVARGEERRDEPLFFLSSGGATAGVRSGRWLCLLHLRPNGAEGPWTRLFEKHEVELYDLEQDRDGRRDLARERVGVARRLRKRIVEWLGRARPLSWAGETPPDPEIARELAALGYVGGAGEGRDSLFEPDDCAWCQRFQEEP